MVLTRLTKWANKLDDYFRERDFAAGRTAGGYLERHFAIRRHTIWALIPPAAACFLAVLATPSWPRFVIALAVGGAVFGLLARLMAANSRKERPLHGDLYLQLTAVFAVVIAICLLTGREYSARWPYQNLLLPLLGAVGATLLAAGFLAESLFRGLRKESTFASGLARTELFAGRGLILDVTPWRLLTAFVIVPFRAPLQLLLPPAFAALFAPPEWLKELVAVTFVVSLVALVLSGLNERFGVMLALLGRPFLENSALLLSVFVIALAAARFWGVTYVTTIFDTAAGLVILTVLLSLYVLCWWFRYWTNRLLSDQLIRILNPASLSGEVTLKYAIDDKSVATHVPADGRVLQLHGSSRFIAIREHLGQVTFFQSYPALDVFSMVSASGAPGGRAVPTLLQLNARVFTYYSLTAALLAAILIGGGIYVNRGVQAAELETAANAGGGIPLASLLAKPSGDRTLFVIAASGGGTRAALFTTAILEGIASRGKAGDLVLGSGVSGGGAALAYFTGFRESLVNYDRAAWKEYYGEMKAPYIREVIDRASEWRMVREGRLGMLLRESFERHWGLTDESRRLSRCAPPASGPGCSFGLILNTTLAGQLHLDKEPPAGKSLADVEPEFRKNTNASVAGGRLILTNLALPSGFAAGKLEPGGAELPVVVRGPSANLEHGAALNANFPPVFANAAIDVGNRDRYWTTDGGAADNRGMEMLLYSILDAIRGDEKRPLPPLHIIVADAGAYSDEYVQDRGVSSALGAGAHFASALDSRLIDAIRDSYSKQGVPFAFNYVYMPRPLRASGSFGTHWMLQDYITVQHEKSKITIRGEEMVDVLRSLYVRVPLSYRDGSPLVLSSDACKVLQWAHQESSPENSREEWRAVAMALGDTSPDVLPSCP